METKLQVQRDIQDNKVKYIEALERYIKTTEELIEYLKPIKETPRGKREIAKLEMELFSLNVELLTKKSFVEVFKQKIEWDELEFETKKALAEKDYQKVIRSAIELIKNPDVPAHHRKDLNELVKSMQHVKPRPANEKEAQVYDENKVKGFELLANSVATGYAMLKRQNQGAAQ